MHGAWKSTILAALLSGAAFSQSPETPVAFEIADAR